MEDSVYHSVHRMYDTFTNQIFFVINDCVLSVNVNEGAHRTGKKDHGTRLESLRQYIFIFTHMCPICLTISVTLNQVKHIDAG